MHGTALTLLTQLHLLHEQQAVESYSSSLFQAGCEFHRRGLLDESRFLYEAARRLLLSPSRDVCLMAENQLHLARQRLVSGDRDAVWEKAPMTPDIFQEDECDAGPRVLNTPVRINSCTDGRVALEKALIFNMALLAHRQENYGEAHQLYIGLVNSIQTQLPSQTPPNLLDIELAARAHNNLGQLYYLASDEVSSSGHFEAALVFAEQLQHQSNACRLDYTNILSNWARIQWMSGDMSDALVQRLRTVLRIRSELLPAHHADTAASHFNLGITEYARQHNMSAVTHLKHFLHIAAGKPAIDRTPAISVILLIQHEERDDNISQELVRGLRTLQDKRQEMGYENLEVASVLNFVGTLLFHMEDYENALVFFQEELALEQLLFQGKDDISVAVTCNNIGRILQELCRYPEATEFYKLAIKSEYGDIMTFGKPQQYTTDLKPTDLSNSSPSAANLYSTVWYNLGLIHDKLRAFPEAIQAFKMSLELRTSMLGRDHPDIACLRYNIGVLQMEQQQLSDASESFREALRIRRAGTAGQLNDQHVIKTLEKLSSLHKAKGNIKLALDALSEVLMIQEASKDLDEGARLQSSGVTLRSMAELHHAAASVSHATRVAWQSVIRLKQATELVTPTNDTVQLAELLEQLVNSFLLVGSIYHEDCQSAKATSAFQEAALVLEESSMTSASASLVALQEVTRMLASVHCAAEA